MSALTAVCLSLTGINFEDPQVNGPLALPAPLVISRGRWVLLSQALPRQLPSRQRHDMLLE